MDYNQIMNNVRKRLEIGAKGGMGGLIKPIKGALPYLKGGKKVNPMKPLRQPIKLMKPLKQISPVRRRYKRSKIV